MINFAAKNDNEMKHKLFFLGSMALSVSCILSCVTFDDSLDLEKDLSLDMRLGKGGLFIPVGTLDTIWTDSLFNPDNADNASLRCLENGVLALCLTGGIDGLSYNLEPVAVKIGNPETSAVIPDFGNLLPDIPFSEVSCTVSDNLETGAVDVVIDDAVKSLSGAGLTQPASVSISIGFQNLPASADSVFLKEYEIVLPSYMNLSYDNGDSRVSYDSAGHVMVFDGRLTEAEISASGNGLTIGGLSLCGMNFDTNPVKKSETDTRLVIESGTVRSSGMLVIDGSEMQKSDFSGMKMNTGISIDGFSIGSVTGTVIPDMDSMLQSLAVSLGKNLDFLRNRENSISLSDMYIALNLDYNIPADWDLSVEMMSKDRNGRVLSGGFVAPDCGDVNLRACPVADDTCSTAIILHAGEAPAISGNDTIAARFSSLHGLIPVMPDSVLFRFDAAVGGSGGHTFTLSNLFVNGSYEIVIPLSFEESTIVYTDTIDGLGRDIEDVAEYIGNADGCLRTCYESTVPFSVVLNAWAIDSLKRRIPEVSFNPVTVPAGNGSELKTEDVSLKFSVREGGMEKIDGIVFSASCSTAGSSLKSGGFILVRNAFMAFDRGLDVDLSELVK